MKVLPTSLRDVLVLEPQVFGDERGCFFESFNCREFSKATGLNVRFVQDNHSLSRRDVLRGLHYQIADAQGKLVRVVKGKIFDVAVDLRRGSGQFGMWTGLYLDAESRRQVWIPPGFAHGFLVVSEVAEVLYKTTEYWSPEYERTLRWDDPQVGVRWPLGREPVLSVKDRSGALLPDCELFD